MSDVRLFISYRRADSEHAAQRVRERLQARFGEDGVFIDREMPAGVDWSQTLARNIAEASGVVVMIGERFVELLDAARARHEPDPMVVEVVAALQAGKRIYPVVTGLRDMPAPQQLPEELRPLLRYNAVFAPPPYFDAAMDALTRAVEADHQWVGAAEPAPPGARGAAARPWAGTLWGRWLATAIVALGVMALCGHLVGWLAALPAGGGWEAALWHGARYVLATLFLGLGPFLARWLVSEMRARSFLPVNNFMGLITSVNMGGMLGCGALFLLLSTIPGWRLVPLLPRAIFPAQPGAWHYVMLALMLLALAVAAVALAVYEPAARRQRNAGRTLSLHTLHALAVALLVGVGWFALSLVTSAPVPADLPLVPMVGYVMLCPVLSLLLGAAELAPHTLGTAQARWPFRTLLAMLVALYVQVTMALWADGPVRVFVAAVAPAG